MQSNEEIIAYGKEFIREYAIRAKKPGLEKILDSCDNKIAEFQKSIPLDEEQMFSLYEMIGTYSSKLKEHCRKNPETGEISHNTLSPEEYIIGTSKDAQEFEKEEVKLEEKAKRHDYMGFLLKPLEDCINYLDDPEQGASENSSENLYLGLRFIYNMIRTQEDATEDYFRRISRVLRWMPEVISTEDYSFVPTAKETDKLVEHGEYFDGPKDKDNKKSLKQRYPELFKNVIETGNQKRDCLAVLNLIFENPYKPANPQEWEAATMKASFYNTNNEKEEIAGKFRIKDNDSWVEEDPRHDLAYRAVRMAGSMKHGKHTIELLKAFIISNLFSENVKDITDKASLEDFTGYIKKVSEDLTPADSSEDDPSGILHDQ